MGDRNLCNQENSSQPFILTSYKKCSILFLVIFLSYHCNMFCLVDCNNFYASCERVFQPSYVGKPVVVLSNNDGCVIARSNEAKTLGIKMGTPVYQIKDKIQQYDIAVFSSNYTLYGDMSARVMAILGRYVEEMEIYSIDEAFLNFKGFENYDLKSYGKEIVRAVTRGTGIPVSMGIAPTKTLAKVANKFAKKYKGYLGVCMIDTDDKREKALKLFEIGDVWGIGHQHEKKLNELGVKTAYDFTQLPQNWVRKNMAVTGERTWKELQGESCIDIEVIAPDKKQICTSRAFGVIQTTLDGLSEAVATYGSICAEKLRKQNACAVSLMVFIHTNNFREDLPQYFKNYAIKLPVPTNSTLEIVHYALEALKKIFKEGYYYKKAGVIITEIIDNKAIQTNLFDKVVNRDKQQRLMQVVDHLNSGFTKNTLHLAVQGIDRKWQLKQELLSKHYTTNFDDIITIVC